MKYIAIALLFLSAALAGAAERVVSLSPNLTEIIFALGGEKALVGRTSVCNYPPEALKLPVAGDYGKIYTEPLVALRPTLVITEKTWDESIPELLRKLKIRHLVFANDSIDDYLKITTELGELLDCRAKAGEIVKNTRAEMDKMRAEARKIPLEKRPGVLVVIGANPLITAGKSSFITDMIEIAGGRNIAGTQDQRYFTCSLEWVVQQQPDILIMPKAHAAGIGAFTENPAIKGLPAVKNNRILTEIDEELLYRLGPRTIDGIRLLKQYFSAK